MTWFVVVGLQPSMGVAWHRFLAILNVYARREVDGSKALGPLQPLMVGDEPLTEATMDTLEAVSYTHLPGGPRPAQAAQDVVQALHPQRGQRAVADRRLPVAPGGPSGDRLPGR